MVYQLIKRALLILIREEAKAPCPYKSSEGKVGVMMSRVIVVCGKLIPTKAFASMPFLDLEWS